MKSAATSESVLEGLTDERNFDFHDIAPEPHEKKNAADERPVSRHEAKLASDQPVTTRSPETKGLKRSPIDAVPLR
jgi:hypothetical protein